MRQILFFLMLITIVHACKKDNSGDGNPPAESYYNATSGSEWTYRETNSSSGVPQESTYKMTSTSRDTSINGKSYHIFSYSFGGSKYLNKTDNDYYEYADFAELGQAFERLYLKANAPVNTTWTQEVNIPVPDMPITLRMKLNNQISSKGSRTVNGVAYDDVIHVTTTITSSDIPASNLQTDIHSYFAPKYGLIENSTKIDVDYLGFKIKVDMKTLLESAILR